MTFTDFQFKISFEIRYSSLLTASLPSPNGAVVLTSHLIWLVKMLVRVISYILRSK